MTVKVTFFVGLNDKDTHVQAFDALAAQRIVSNVFLKHKVDGATITLGTGIYTHADKTVVTEQTIIVQVFEFGEPIAVAEICNDLKAMLNQESIAVEKQETNSTLY